jgi:hypothetical protein
MARNKHNDGQGATGASDGGFSPSAPAEKAENISGITSSRSARSLSSALSSVGAPRPGLVPLSYIEKHFGHAPDDAGAGYEDAFFPAAPGRRSEQGGPDLRLFTGGLTDYARLAADDEEYDGTEQRLAERFASRPPEPVQVPERPMMQALIPYLAAAGFFIFAGAGSAIYFFKSGSPDWGGSGSARAVIVSEPKIDSALTSFVPKTIQGPSEERAAPAEEEADETPVPAQSVTWAETVDTFKALAAAKPPAGSAKSDNANPASLLKAVEAWHKNGG